MLLSLCERILGLDTWTQAEATIQSSTLARVEAVWSHVYGKIEPVEQWWSKCIIEWTDQAGSSHSANYAVPECSPLFHVYDGQKLTVRYDPSHPGRVYLRGLLQSRIFLAFRRTLFVIAFAALGVLLTILWVTLSASP